MSINPALRTANTAPTNIKQMIQFMRTAQNPQMAMQNLMRQNPQLMQAANFVRSMNTDPRTAFYQLAQQKGIDGDAFLQDLMN